MTIRHPAVPITIKHVGAAAEARLRQLAVPGSAPLVDAIRDGASGYRATTPFHPSGYGGHRMWGETVNSVRTNLHGHGWEREGVSGVDLTVNRGRGIAIIVAAGDGATGDDRANPQFRYDHAGVISQIVAGHLDNLFNISSGRPDWEVWFLLHFISTAVVKAELSRPTGIGRAGWVTGWIERILLPTQPFAGPGAGSRPSGDSGDVSGPASVDVPVRRRVG